MTTAIHDLLLGPGELAALLAARKLVPAAGSPLAAAGVLAPAATTRSVSAMAAGVPAADLDAALRIVAQPERVLAGRRAARRNEPWPFFICLRNGVAAILATEPGGAARLRFPYSDTALLDWLGGPFQPFVAPEIPIPALPSLAPSGLLVLFALADIYRVHYPDPDPKLKVPAPDTFTAEDVHLAIGRGLDGSDPASLILGFNRLGEPGLGLISREELEGVLFVFANEGWLRMDADGEAPTFTLGDSFAWTIMTLAWWDLSLAVGAPGRPPLRFIQGLAVWSFEPQPDGRYAARVVAGAEVTTCLAALLGKSAVRFCSACGAPNPPTARFCKGCGKEMGSDRKFVK